MIDAVCPHCPQTETETQDLPLEPGHGQWFGIYQTIRTLGEGGMGIVYLARQEQPIRRQVALKVIKQGMDTREVIARFESERQALALMDHPNIAKIFDAGATPEGRPYFVMEYVAGIPITGYCDRHRLGNRERLELFCQVCQAIHHAHQKGVIHRDIKPSNILIEVRDGKAVPKVIDFGVAKAISQRLTEKTVFTAMGMMIGTPAYMSPEQAGLTALDVDTTTDIYSLGVVLYEMMVGALPFDPSELREAGYAEICRVIREEEPLKLTTKLESLGATATEVARRRHTDVRALARQLRGDLEWITTKALEKDRIRRYASASELAADIGRHLSNEPVIAGPHSVAYRLRKFTRKNKGAVIAAALILSSLFAGLCASTLLFLRSEKQRARAEAQGYVASLNAADAHLRANDVTSAEASLRQVDPHLRSWEWRHLYGRLDPAVLTLYAYHLSGSFSSLSFSPDSSRLIWGTREIVHVWDGSTYSHIGDYGGFGEIVAVNDEGTRLLSKDEPVFTQGIGWTCMFRVFEMASRKEVAAISDGPIPTMTNYLVSAFSADGKRAALGWEDGVLRVYDIESGRKVFSTNQPASRIRAVAFTPAGDRIISGAEDGNLRMWDLSTGKLAVTMQGHAGPVMALAFSADGEKVASGSVDQTVRIWDRKTGGALATLAGHEGPVRAVSFSRDGRRIVSGSNDRYVRVWDVDRKAALATLTGNDSPVSAVAFNQDGTKVLSGSTGILVRVWDAPAGQAASSTEPGLFSPLISRDGARVVSTAGPHLIQVTDALSGKKICEWQEKQVSVLAAFSPDGRRILARREVRDAATCARLMIFDEQFDAAAAAFNSDGSRIVVVRNQNLLEMWDVARNKKLWSTQLRDPITAVAFSSDGRRVVSAAAERNVTSDPTAESSLEIRDADSGQPLAALKNARGWIVLLAFSSDGNGIAAGTARGEIQVWNIANPETRSVLPGHTGAINAIVFSSDGSRIASGADDSTLRIWDAARHEPLLTLRGHATGVSGVAFSPDGSRIVSVDRRVGIRFWDAMPAYLVEARELVASLFRKTRLTADVLQTLQKDSSLDHSVRQAALRIAEAVGDDPLALEQESLKVAKAPGATAEAYQKALERAERAQHLRPWRTSSLTTLGVAQYRTGAYQSALETLTRATQASGNNAPCRAALLAMTLHRLGKKDEARAAMERLNSLAKNFSANTRNRELEDCIREAGQVMEGPVSPSTDKTTTARP